MLRAMRRVIVLVGVAFVCVSGCKEKTSTSTSATTASASASGPSGKCTLVVDKPKCLADGKAAFCEMSSKSGTVEVAWQTFTCPDCALTERGKVKCSAYTAGEPCNMLLADDACSKDGKSEFTCEMATSTWKVQPCLGGCTGDMEKGLMCR